MRIAYTSLIGVGGYVPPHVVTNFDLEKTLDTSHEWIVQRTGIHSRHIAKDETTAFMACQAGLQALDRSRILPQEIDLILVATTTPDHAFPSVASRVQHMIGASNAKAFDLQAVCSGFIYALETAGAYIQSHKAQTVLVIGAERLSTLVDWTDRGTAVLFGDGAGAVILKKTLNKEEGIHTLLKTDGSLYDILYVQDKGEGRRHITMNGRELFRHAVPKMTQVSQELLQQLGVSLDSIDWLIPHQANIRILQSVCEHLSFPVEKMIVSLGAYANTSAASIPMALNKGVSEGLVKQGHTLLMTAFGGGLTWGASFLPYRGCS